MSRRLKLIIAYDGAPFAAGKVDLIATPSRITSSARLTTFLASRRASRRRTNGRRRACTRAMRARRSSRQPLISCTLVQSAQRLVASDYSRSSLPICVESFSRGFRRKEKSIAIESGYPPFCLHSNMVAPGISRVRLISRFSGEQPGCLSVLSFCRVRCKPWQIRSPRRHELAAVRRASKKRARSVQFIRWCPENRPLCNHRVRWRWFSLQNGSINRWGSR